MRNKRYYGINIIILVFTIFFFFRMVLQNVKWLHEKANIVPVFLISLICIIIVHTIKAVRLYFIILEKRPTIARFLKLYIKTTLVNLVFPFKLGEFFRMYSFGHELGDYKVGVLLILVDRYFDSIPLLTLLLGFTLIGQGTLHNVVIILIIFILAITVLYGIFPSTYKYMNRFLIVDTNSEKGILALDLLKKLDYWYAYIKELVNGREFILLVLSSCAWLAEFGALYCLIAGTGHIFLATDFLVYMNSVFMGFTNEYVSLYIGVSAAILVGASGIAYGSAFAKRKRKVV